MEDGSLETGRARQDERTMKGAVDKKAVLMVWELKTVSYTHLTLPTIYSV